MIRNIVFDVGNVLVRWDSLGIVQQALGLSGEAAMARRDELFSHSAIWLGLNRGEFTEAEARQAYVEQGHLSPDETERMFCALYASLHLLADTPPLMERLRAAGFRLFALTDNVHEIVAHLKERDDWWAMFDGATVSAEVGVLKPDPRIYSHLLGDHSLVPEETVFFDDVPANVAGAQAAGIHAFVFTDSAQAERDLQTLEIELA